LSSDQLTDWGWRIPFLFGILVGPVGVYIRRRLDETPEFVEIRPTRTPVRNVLRDHPIEMLLAIGAAAISNSSAYIILYIPTYAIKELHLPQTTGFTATLVGAIILGVASPFAGHLSDKLGRGGPLQGTAWLFLLSTYPLFFLMVAFPSLATAIFAAGWLSLVKAGYSGVLPSQLAELFPTATRGIGVSLSFAIAVTIFGGFTPFVATSLIAMTGNRLSPSFYIMFTAALSIIALVFVQRGRYPRTVPANAAEGLARVAAGTHFNIGPGVAEPGFSSPVGQRRSWPAASPARNLLGRRNIDSTSAPFGERAMWRLPLGRHT
jgi:MHS family proline/betaine transporter-like MFS transporter